MSDQKAPASNFLPVCYKSHGAYPRFTHTIQSPYIFPKISFSASDSLTFATKVIFPHTARTSSVNTQHTSAVMYLTWPSYITLSSASLVNKISLYFIPKQWAESHKNQNLCSLMKTILLSNFKIKLRQFTVPDWAYNKVPSWRIWELIHWYPLW